ncbi:MAG: BolA family transcriptional regulator [Cyanobacteria bacterium]|nr:BolA family transcriptional regulator [Cyanobacteriota bacterium]
MSPSTPHPIAEKIKEALSAVHVELVDNSWMHAGHAGASGGGSHLHITIVSPVFEGISLLEQHRKVHQVLKEEMAHAIHALELVTLTPAKWEEKTKSPA